MLWIHHSWWNSLSLIKTPNNQRIATWIFEEKILSKQPTGIDKVMKAKDKGSILDIIYLDFAKAFDKVHTNVC